MIEEAKDLLLNKLMQSQDEASDQLDLEDLEQLIWTSWILRLIGILREVDLLKVVTFLELLNQDLLIQQGQWQAHN